MTYAHTDAETPTEMMDRLIGMASGRETWDLSDNDQAAIQYALDRIAQLESMQPTRSADRPRNPEWHEETLPIPPYQRIGQAIANITRLHQDGDFSCALFHIEDADLRAALEESK
jgi:hypothetical protein